MSPAPLSFRIILRALVAVVTAAVGLDAADSKPKKPPPPTDWAEWNNVVRFRGQFQSTRENRRFQTDSTGAVERGHHVVSVNGTFVMERRSASGWEAKDGWISGSNTGFSETHRWSYHGRNTHTANYSGASKNFELRLYTKEGTWDFISYGRLDQPYLSRNTLDSRTWQFLDSHWGWKEIHRAEDNPANDGTGGTIRGELAKGKPQPLSGTLDKTTGTLDQGISRVTAHVLLVPEFRDVELIVEIDGVAGEGSAVAYEKWIPRGTPGGEAGSRLKIRARLQAPDGSAVQVRVDHFSFELRDTSREPGVCLNFPLAPGFGDPVDAEFNAPDLKFMPNGATDADRQHLTAKPMLDEPGHPRAEASILCFDYGAWANLVVTAHLEDGRTITGHLEDDPATLLIALPKRTGGSLIADAWKEEHELSGGDVDDGETLPNAGKAPGDGFTLYEEYRGFIENGRHLEGDPKKIDFFVRNYIGGDAEPGLWLFEELTGAEVHTQLGEKEFDPEQRVMNANHDRGPHHVDQHGVFVYEEAGRDGAAAVFTEAGVRGRPRTCKGIFVQPREAITSITTSENLPISDLIFTYDRAIAHELLHAVGVEHHGKGDGAATFHFVAADDPRNPAGRPVFWIGNPERRAVVTVLDEATGRDLAELWAQGLVPQRERDRSAEDSDGDAYSSRLWFVGAEHGEGSGDEACVMRYYFAQVYEKKGSDKKIFYYISRGQSERASLSLCHSLAGTGVNLAGRQPQSRYGDAQPGWGPCADWIVFNDAVPPDPDPK